MRPRLWAGQIKLPMLRLLSRVRTRLLGPYAVGVLVESKQGRFLVPAADLAVGRKLAYGGSYDEAVLALYEQLVEEQSSVLVVGAHIGAILIPLGRRVRRMVAVEANPEIFAFTTMNVQLNNLENVELHNVAASDTSGTLDFLCSSVNSGGSKMVPKAQRMEFYYDGPTRRTVAGVRLDDVFNESFDLILMDIEGGEYAALGGMPRLLARARTLVLEVLPNHLDHVSGVSFDAFIERIPPHLERFFLTSRPNRVVGRDGLSQLYAELENGRYFSGADLVCTSCMQPATG